MRAKIPFLTTLFEKIFRQTKINPLGGVAAASQGPFPSPVTTPLLDNVRDGRVFTRPEQSCPFSNTLRNKNEVARRLSLVDITISRRTSFRIQRSRLCCKTIKLVVCFKLLALLAKKHAAA